jgi:hypothetical protein
LVLVSAVASVVLLLLATVVGPSRARQPRFAVLPSPRDLASVEVSLWGEQIGRKEFVGFRVDERDWPMILRCLSPAEYSEKVGKMMVFPPLGKIRFRLKDERERELVFVEAGKNPLCFTLDGIPYLRGGKSYVRYLEDHRDLYGFPYENLDEAMCLADKLSDIGIASEVRR